ncbi:ABC transporter ATP-binding protein [Anaeromicropila herbilytica]|uniref:Multidrug ABC transporter ATP-binding protein n=1 Tax=Anaeromicropila herbilytica TaxID=2785025 RepID=A0A7R7IAS7_9FIRM|nr:ABC transporter ATP-binding protein [Anaeromicropila herbilytica]BCN28773.1 multidrug ABC transporter ATP-binding protein [Anaeromicropila herbilytica]
MMKLIKYSKGYRVECIIAPIFKNLEAILELLVPLVMATIINVGIVNHDKNYIIRMCGCLVLLGMIGLACSITAQYFAAKASIGIATSIRHHLFSHIHKMGYSEIDRIGTSTLITRMTSDINQVQSGLNLFLRLFLRSPFVVIGSIVMAFTIDKKVALIFVIAVPILSLIVTGIMLGTKPLYKKIQKKLDKILSITRENLTGVRVIRAFGREKEEEQNFHKENQIFTRMQQRVGRVSSIMNPATYIVVNLAIVAILNTGAGRVNIGTLKQGDVIALVNYMSQILVEVIKLSNLTIQVTRALACSKRVEEILDIENELEYNHAKIQRENNEAVRFNNVSFTYEGALAPSLSGVTFQANKGEMIGIIGGTGAGKTSLVNLIPRFYDATEGDIQVLGRSIKDYSKEQLQSGFGVVPQRAQLFSGTIRSNLLLGNENATEEELWDALRIAQAEEFVQRKELQLDEVVEQGGRNLSGGQKQRLTIARAMVSKPQILILDDSASALDLATDAALRKALKNSTKDMTVFIVSQRISSIQNADKILVLNEGNLVGVGTHEDLLTNCSVYQEIYESQYKKGETDYGKSK